VKAVFTINRLFIAALVAMLINGSAFAFAELDGKKTTIKDNIGKGKWTVAEVWSHGCHACRDHMPSMVEFDGKLDNTRLLGIAIDGKDKEGVEKAESMIEEYDMKFKTIVSNPIELNDWMLENADEGLRGTPTFMIFDPKGELVAMQAGQISTEAMEKFIKSRM